MSKISVNENPLRASWRQVISRKDGEARDWLSKNLDSTEHFNVLRQPNGLGLTPVILSIRSEELLRRLHRDVFAPAFEMPVTWVDERGVRSAWFGYSEPWNLSRTYVPIEDVSVSNLSKKYVSRPIFHD